jgi:RNA polymerase sigma factor, sigma-70 family
MPTTMAAWQKVVATNPEPAATADDDSNDRELVARSRAGDLAAFEVLYRRHEGTVFRFALRQTDSADDADDVRQETFVRAYQSLARYRGDARFRTYLLTICANLCRDRLRGRLRRPERGYGLELPEGVAFAAGDARVGCPVVGLERAADAALVRAALRQMPPAAREVLLLRHVEELDFDEIARVLGCTRLSVPVRLFRARNRFREVFASLTRDES